MRRPPAGYKDQRGVVKGGCKGEHNSLPKYPPDTENIWGILPYSWKGHSEESTAGRSLLLEVAGRPHPLAGRLGVKRVNHLFWPARYWGGRPMCVQHNHVIEIPRKWAQGVQQWLGKRGSKGSSDLNGRPPTFSGLPDV